jgi:uncharacterized protein (DUF1800 family)
VLRTLFSSEEFFNPKYRGNRLKSPLRQVVSAVRATGAEPRDTAALAGAVAALGQPLFAAGAPDGYPVTTAAWLKPLEVARRVSLAGDLVSRRLPVLPAKTPGLSVPTLLDTLGPSISVATRKAVDKTRDHLGAALILASPDFMRY